MDEARNPKNWTAVLTPHRSLSRQGFLTVMGLIAGVNFVAGLVFYHLGAWPVVGFCGLDVLLMYLAFRRNFADARRAERIEITEAEVILDRLAEGKAPQQQRFIRNWVRVSLEEDVERELIGALYLTSHGRRTEIASFLAPFEKKELAKALKAALVSPYR
ncbi:DUF2244 domain-containing protein [Aestuariivirga sp.]|uniref:DUF2244 domain-containing protein n=1 Tax=Aestuariivirga sp. TaxID=2650926 RepID=UPI0039E45013